MSVLLPAAWLATAATLAASSVPGPAVHGVLPFIASAYAKAVPEERARKVPLFVEACAPW